MSASGVGVEAPVFVFGCCHRTGSTLLQRLLNSNEQFMIWGEHDGYLTLLLDGYYRLINWKNANPDTASTFLSQANRQFLPNVLTDSESIEHAFALHIKALFPIPPQRPLARRWGFKEVRYTAHVALFLQRFFPDASFIHVVRSARDCLRSLRDLERAGFWRPLWTEQALQNWAAINSSFRDLSSQLNHYHLLRYPDLEDRNSKVHVDRIEEFLGLAHDSLDREILKVRVDFNEPRKNRYRLSEEDKALLANDEYRKLHDYYGV